MLDYGSHDRSTSRSNKLALHRFWSTIKTRQMIEQIKIAVTLQDDTLVIMSIVINDGNGYKMFPSDYNIEKEITRQFEFKTWRKIQEEEIIQDRSFRSAWRDNGERVHVHMPAAREIHRNRLRYARAEKLISLDAEYLKADEAGDMTAKAEVSKRKQKLRDITKHPGIEEAQTPEDLIKIWI